MTAGGALYAGWIQRYLRGEPTTQIAEAYGVSPTRVRRVLLRLGVQLRLAGGGSRRRTP